MSFPIPRMFVVIPINPIKEEKTIPNKIRSKEIEVLIIHMMRMKIRYVLSN